MSKKKKRLKYLNKLKEQKEKPPEEEHDSSFKESSKEIPEKNETIEEKKLDEKEKEFDEKKTEKWLLVFILIFICILIFTPGEVLNKISIFINKIL